VTRSNDESASVKPDVLYVIGSAGAVARPAEWVQFLFEGGMGPIFVRGQKDIGIGIYIGTGITFDIEGTAGSKK
jgi:hypothetical protein